MLPVIELRGGIPFGATNGLTVWQAFFVSVLGNIVVAIIILALLFPVFELLKRVRPFARTVEYFTAKFTSKATKANYVYLFIFSALPIPLTGVWTASAVATFAGMKYLRSLVSIALGTVVSGLIITLSTILLGDNAVWLFYGFAVMAVLVIGAIAFKVLLRKSKKLDTLDVSEQTNTNDSSI